MASSGWSFPLRRRGGRVAGRVQMYSALNVDAARAARRRRAELARRLAAHANELERSTPALVIRDAVVRASERLSAHLAGHVRDDAWTDRLQRYLELRQGAGWESLDRDALAREWLVHSEAWLRLDPVEEEGLIASVRALAASAQSARAEAFADEQLQIDSFTGVVRHLDPENAEIVSEAGEAWVVSRRELDREGLAQLGEAVSIIREELPAGGEAWLAAAAADLSPVAEPPPRGRNEITPFMGPPHWVLAGSDAAWLKRALGRDPFILPRTPVLLGPKD
jgi:hypothetical protein